jgi:hypothetical protein
MEEMFKFPLLKSRSKAHMIAHVAAETARFGPLINSITESFEGLNKYCRERFLFSNNMSPGRDTAADYAKIDGTNFVIEGGVWKCPGEGKL